MAQRGRNLEKGEGRRLGRKRGVENLEAWGGGVGLKGKARKDGDLGDFHANIQLTQGFKLELMYKQIIYFHIFLCIYTYTP